MSTLQKGSLEKLFPSYWKLCNYIEMKSSSKRLFFSLVFVYLFAIFVLSSLPSIDWTTDGPSDASSTSTSSSKSQGQSEQQERVAKSLLQVLDSVGPQVTLFHLSLLLVLGGIASIISTLTLSLVMSSLCRAEDYYFPASDLGDDAQWPFRAVSLSPIPFFWWSYFELSEKSLMIWSALFYRPGSKNFTDYSLLAPIESKWTSFNFIFVFSCMTLGVGVLKLLFVYLTFPKPASPLQHPPPGLTKANDIKEETWMKSDKPPVFPPSSSSKSSRKPSLKKRK